MWRSRVETSTRNIWDQARLTPYAALAATGISGFHPTFTLRPADITSSVRPCRFESGVHYKRASSVESNAITYLQRSRRLDHGVHASARKLSDIADLNPVVPSERAEDVGVVG